MEKKIVHKLAKLISSQVFESNMTSQQQRINAVKIHLEQRLDSPLDIAQLASLACVSHFHFCRLFHAYVGESIYAYRKRLLLERSLNHLRFSQLTLIDIASQSGYQNQASFNKAFKQQFEQTPLQIRNQAWLKPEQHSVKANKLLARAARQIEVIELAPQSVLSKREQGPYLQAAPKAWRQLFSACNDMGLDTQQSTMIGISYDDPSVTHPEQVRFDACLSLPIEPTSPEALPSTSQLAELGIQQLTLAGGLFAKLRHHGGYANIPSSYQVVLRDWLPQSNYQLRDANCLEIYHNKTADGVPEKTLITDLLLPIQ
ncbi:GyrI-like domain-containing protein [Agarivorans sp. Alg241-V36]|uniref:AraC family transcriptional regulator n=1 Tax=Agarivorans sp. Alg241-V36 TaxID=2305992 RepID=UPI0013D661F6|nr:AraC family transcriptional regulator [Agarivorans sp. Alg241-V36]